MRYSDYENELAAIIGRNLERLRKERGMTQKQLCSLFGISGTMIYQYESGISRIPITKAIRLCEHLECTLEDLTEGTQLCNKTTQSTQPTFRTKRTNGARCVNETQRGASAQTTLQ